MADVLYEGDDTKMYRELNNLKLSRFLIKLIEFIKTLGWTDG